MSIKSPMRALLLAVLPLGLLALFALGAAAQPAEDSDVRFEISPRSDRDVRGARRFVATHGEGDQQARFVIELDAERNPVNLGEPGFYAAFSTGRFRHVAGSRPEAFLARLASALDAKAPRRSAEKATVLPFKLVYLGHPSARSPLGGFGDAPGDWFATKLFLANGDGEVFFNFNPVSGEAEFSIKDSEYGDVVVREMSKILW